MCTIIRHISSYIKGILFFAATLLNLVASPVRAAGIDIEKFLDPSNPYKVNSAEDLAAVFNAFDEAYLGGNFWITIDTFCFCLENDIDMKGVEILSFQTDDQIAVKFDGKGHTIKNLTFEGYRSSGYSGLFPVLDKGSCIKNVTFENIDATLPSKTSGILTGYVNGSVRIENCKFSGKATFQTGGKTSYIGGLIGMIFPPTDGGVIKDVTVDLEYDVPTSFSAFGGVIGYINSPSNIELSNIVNKSKNTVSLQSITSGAGGILGYILRPRNLKIHDCSNYLGIESSSPMVGGIIGNFDSPPVVTINELYNCSNAGNIYSEYGDVGGIAGITKKVKIYNCVNIGDVTSYQPSVSVDSKTRESGAGGIVGTYNVYNVTTQNNTLSSCINMGYVSSLQGGNIAGIVGCYYPDQYGYQEVVGVSAALIFPFNNCLSISFDNSNRVVKSFEFNNRFEFNALGGLYSDESFGVTESNDSIHYVKNSVLTSGNTPFYYFSVSESKGYMLDNQTALSRNFNPAFLQKPGFYPYLSMNDDIAKLASLPILIADGERLDSIASGFSCGMTDGVVWKSAKGNFEVTKDGVANILGAGNDTVYGILGDAVISRPITLYKNVFGGGRGTAANPYLLKSVAHLQELQDSLETAPGWSKNKHFKVAAHISDLDFALAQTTNTQFMGELDGGGYTIKMNIASSSDNAALFVYAESASIHDLQTSGSVSGNEYAAGVCAVATKCDIYNCYNSAKISAITAGGVVAYSKGGNLYGLCNSGTITASKLAAGVIGTATDINTTNRISDLVNSGYVNGDGAVGLIGDAERVSASYAFNRLINYGSLNGKSITYPYIYTSQFSGYTYPDCHYDVQISRNGKCDTKDFMGSGIGVEIVPTTATDVMFEKFSDDANAVYVPSFMKNMKNAELLGIVPIFENEELTSYVQTAPSLLTEGKLVLRKLTGDTEYAKLSDLKSSADVPALLVQKSEGGDERLTYITIASIPFASGDGSAEDPYLIESLSDLNSLAALVKANKVTDKYYINAQKNNWSYNKHFKLTVDILGDGTASTIVTDAIASEATPFQGVFDGNGHTIKVSINNQNQNNQALFANIESGAVIENLIVTGVVNGNMGVSGVVAVATHLNPGDVPVIRKVINNATVTGSAESIGGICGKSEAIIEDCANAGSVSITIKSTPYYTGGIAGSTTANIIRCMNVGNVFGHRRVGGICGGAMCETKGLIKDCINYGMVHSICPPSADFACLGGIVGSADKFDVESSINVNRVSCPNEVNVDAIAGSVVGEVKNCYYDKQMSVLPSKYGTGLLTTEMFELTLDAFNNTSGMYPTLSSPLSAEKLTKLASSPLMLFQSEDKSAYDVVNKMMSFGDVNIANADIKWVRKNGVVDVVNSNGSYVVKPVAVGTDTLTVSYDIYSKQISVDIFCIPVRVDTLITGCQVVSVRKSDGTDIICKNDTVFTEVYKIENSSCDSTIKYTVKVSKLEDYKIDTVLCGKDQLSGASYRGKQYTNTSYITRYDTVGCDSAITTNLRVVIPRVDSVYFNGGCDSVFCEVDGKYYHETVTFYDTLRSTRCGCDSIYIKVNLNVTNSDAYEFDEVYLDSFTINGRKLKGGDELTVYDTLVTVRGCDSIVKRNIHVYDRVFKMDTVVYSCEFYLDNVNSKKITRDTVLIEQLSETLHGIKVDGYYLQKRDIHINHNTSADTVRVPDEYYCERYRLTQNVGGIENVIGVITRDTVIQTNIPRDKKCDSVLIRTIHILPAPVRDTVEIVNCGDFYDATLDTTFTKTQDYFVHKKFNNSFCDCDSSVSLRRYTIRETKHNNINISGCSEAQYTFYGSVVPTTFTSSVDTVDVIRYTSGPVCDSIVNNIHIVVANPIYDTVKISTCGDVINYEGKVYLAQDGDYKETIIYPSAAGCDSLIRVLDFRFVETIENFLPTRYGCDSVVCDLNNKTYYEDHTISVEVGTTDEGCPIINTQSVVVLHPTTTNQEVMGCEFAEYNGNIYYNDTTFQLSLKSTLCDCDSFVNVKVLVLPRIESPTIYLSECDSVIINDPDNGEVVIKEDVDDYQCMFQKVYNVAGKDYICDSIVHYKVHVKKPTYNSVVFTGESSVEYNGVTYRRSQVIKDTLVNAEGCDSFVEIKIVVERDLGYPVIVDKFGYVLFCNNNIGKVKFATYQWYKDGVAIQGATKEYYEGAKGEKLNGCYQVEVTTVAGKEYISETYCVDKDRELKIYPNPVSLDEILTIEYPFTEEEKKNLRVEIYDVMGTMIRDFVPTSYPIQMEIDLPSGHYFVLIYESDARMLDTRFIVR